MKPRGNFTATRKILRNNWKPWPESHKIVGDEGEQTSKNLQVLYNRSKRIDLEVKSRNSNRNTWRVNIKAVLSEDDCIFPISSGVKLQDVTGNWEKKQRD